jgi:hypothetical protein
MKTEFRDPVNITDRIRGAVDRAFASADRQRILDALSSGAISECEREALLVLSFGNTEVLFTLLDHADFRDTWLLEREHDRKIRFHNGVEVRGIGEHENLRRRCELGLPLPIPDEIVHRESLADAVRQFVAAELLFPVEQLTESTELQRDLGLGGTEGERFIRRFGAKFKVDLRAFDVSVYFQQRAGESLWRDVRSLVFRVADKPVVAITIRELLDAIDRGRWTMPRC